MKRIFVVLTLFASASSVMAGPQPSQPIAPRTSADAREQTGAVGQYQKGLQALQERRYEDAKRAFNAALQQDGKHALAMLGLAEVAFQTKDEAALKRWLTQAEKTEPNNAKVQGSVGRFYMMRNQPEQAEAALTKAAQLDPKASLPRTDLAALLMQRGAFGKAVPVWREAVALEPKNARFELGLGVALLRSGQQAQGQAALLRAADLDPKDPKALLALAQAQSNPDDGKKYIDRVLAADPNQYDALMLRAGLHFKNKDMQGTRKALELAAAADTKSAEPWVRLDMLAQEDKQLNEARSAYLKALERDANHPLALNNMAMLTLEAKEDPARAETMARRALRSMPDNAQLYDTLASAQLARKDRKGALASIQQAAKLDPKDTNIQLHLAEIQVANGDREGAKRTATALQGKPGVDSVRLVAVLQKAS